MSKTRQYRIWQGMKERCHNKKHKKYYLYGGRGIRVCDRWENSFENFWEDLKDGYADNLSIDRIDVNGNYEPDNTRWATPSQQGMNKRIQGNNRSSSFKGVHFDEKRNKWRASICLNKKQKHLGRFSTEIEAAQAYNESAKELFKEYSHLNVI